MMQLSGRGTVGVVAGAVVVDVLGPAVVVSTQSPTPHMTGQNRAILAQFLRWKKSPHSASSGVPWHEPGTYGGVVVLATVVDDVVVVLVVEAVVAAVAEVHFVQRAIGQL